MSDKKFAFESDNVSIAFVLNYGLGDCIIAKKVFEALIELAPACLIDIFCVKEHHKVFAKAFYGGERNLNLITGHGEIYKQVVKNYDLAIHVGAAFAVFLEAVNGQRLQTKSPELLQALIKISEYNKRNVFCVSPWGTALATRQILLSRILNKTRYWFLSCGGALPIHDDKVRIPLVPEYKIKFDALKLNRYITIYANIAERERDKPKNKAWPLPYLNEYVALVRKNFPKIAIVQVDGAGSVKIESCDRHYLTNDLELVKYILANSLLHVGCEGGLIHLATALGTKCVVLFGASSCYNTGYDRNINVVSEVCSPCMYILPNYSVCLRGLKEPVCMASITPQHVCDLTCNYLRQLDLKNNA